MGVYFGTDGFRGEAGRVVSCERAFKVGRYLGWYYAKGGTCRAVIGKDPRRSSYMLEYSLAAGVAASGGEAHLMHVTTTASVSYIARADGFDCGVMISASHNPFSDNGIKIFNSLGEKADDALIRGIEEYLDEKMSIPSPTGRDIGRTDDCVSGRNRYTGHLISLAANSYKGLKIGLDCANGSAFAIAPSVFAALGAKVYAIGDKPNGFNINSGCGSTSPAALSRLVTENGLDVGFAFDGDADRCICVDERGRVVDGDAQLYVFARRLKNIGALSGGVIVTTVMSNGGLADSLQPYGIKCVAADVGDRFVYDAIVRSGAAVGGEPSGHVIFSKLENTGDGLVTAINMCEIMCENKCALSHLLEGYSVFPQICAAVQVRDKKSVMDSICVQDAVLCANEHMRGEGRTVVRPSGTENVIRIMAECRDESAARRICAEIAAAVKRADAE